MKGRRRRRHEQEGQRDTTAHRYLPPPVQMLPTNPYSLASALRDMREHQELLQLEDRRTWHPLGDQRPAAALRRSHSSITLGRELIGAVHNVFKFSQPQYVVACARRKARREVMHALKLTRKRGSGGGRRRRNWMSDFSCRG